MSFIENVVGTLVGPIAKRAKRQLNRRNRGATHLFLLSPPLSGSTAVTQLLATSPNVTVFPGNGEGQALPEAKKVLLVDQRWDPRFRVDWEEIKGIFYSYWSPWKRIRFEKSPPNILRSTELEQAFANAHFLLTIRNPYAQIEGLLRRKWPFGPYGPQSTAASPATPQDAARFWVATAEIQKRNRERLANACFFSYEQLTDATGDTIQKILAFLPGIGSLNADIRYTAHNATGSPLQGLQNLNQRKIDRLSAVVLKEINGVLVEHQDVLRYFGYSMVGT